MFHTFHLGFFSVFDLIRVFSLSAELDSQKTTSRLKKKTNLGHIVCATVVDAPAGGPVSHIGRCQNAFVLQHYEGAALSTGS